MTTSPKHSAHFAFFGTPHVGVEILDELANAGYLPALVVTMPDRAKGRGMENAETPVAAWANDCGIEVVKPEKLDAAFIEDFKNRDISFAIVVAYGKILPQVLLDILPMYNIHYSLLPRWRGATPVESAVLAGDAETGVAIQKIVYDLDAGPLLALEKTPIGENETAPALRTRLNGIAGKLLIATMPALISENIPLIEQNHTNATRCGKISKEDGHVGLGDHAEENYRKFRAYFGWPGIYTFFERGGKRIRVIITKAHVEGKKFIIENVKPEGKGEISYEDFLRSGAKPAD